MATYTLSPNASIQGTYYLSEIELAPDRLVRRFGAPKSYDEAKVSGQYIFQDEQGNVFTLYDWKCTTLWEISEGYLSNGAEPAFSTPEEFWSFDEPVPLNIGGHEDQGDVQDFIQWLKMEVGD